MKDFICHIDNKLTLRKIMNLHAKNLAKNHDVLKITFYLIIIFFTKRGRKKYSTQRHTLAVIFKAINYYF